LPDEPFVVSLDVPLDVPLWPMPDDVPDELPLPMVEPLLFMVSELPPMVPDEPPMVPDEEPDDEPPVLDWAIAGPARQSARAVMARLLANVFESILSPLWCVDRAIGSDDLHRPDAARVRAQTGRPRACSRKRQRRGRGARMAAPRALRNTPTPHPFIGNGRRSGSGSCNERHNILSEARANERQFDAENGPAHAMDPMIVRAIERIGPFRLLNALLTPWDPTSAATHAYGEHPRHLLDVYRPFGQPPARGWPVIVFFYGGAWEWGDRTDYRFVGAAFARRGFVAVVADYRLHPEVVFPAFVEDGAAAVAWVHREIEAHGGDPDRIVLAGHSAGAYIAAMVALDARRLDAAGAPPSVVRGVATLAGPFDFLPLPYRRLARIFPGEDLADTQPVRFARGNAPPMLLITGDADVWVWPEHARRMEARLREAGAWVRTLCYERVSHGGLIASLAPPLRAMSPIPGELATFARLAGAGLLKGRG
jgi:acetyl esterase/lipase